MSGEDYYTRLHLRPSADYTMVGQAYWHLARKYHLEMADDVSAKKRLEELNEAFAVLGNAVARSAYDRARAAEVKQGREMGQRRVSIEVSYWRLPAWQGVIAATGGVALAALALLAGASLAATLALMVVTVAAALLPARDEWRVPAHERYGWSTAGERELRALDLERSTASVVSRWRKERGDQGSALTWSRLGLDDDAGHPPQSAGG
jgi:curved DNA-binding protein CbpA